MNAAQKFIDSRVKLAETARRTGIAKCIKLCEISGPASDRVLSHAVRAVLGAVWRDSHKSLETVEHILKRLKYVKNDSLSCP